MYRCGICHVQVGPGVESQMVVIESRPKIYPPAKDGRIPTGHETVREVKACPSCVPASQR